MSKSEFPKPCCSKSINLINTGKNKRKFESNDEGTQRRSKRKDPLSVQLNQCKMLLQNLRYAKEHRDYTRVFLYPVDTVQYDCPNYYDIIKNPMDLSTMQTKMDNGEYKTPEEFEADIRLIIDNCYTYNSLDHDIIPLCKKFQEAFEARFQKIINPKRRISGLSPPREDLLRRSSRSIMTILPDDEEYIIKEIAKTQQYLSKLYEKHKSILENKYITVKERYDRSNESSPKRKKPRKKRTVKKEEKPIKEEVKVEDKTITKEEEIADQLIQNACENSEDEDFDAEVPIGEMRDLIMDVNKLPEDKLGQAIKIIQKLEPACCKLNPKGVDIKFDEFKTKSVRLLQKIVKDFYHPKPPRAAPLPRKEKLQNNKELVQELKVDLENQKKETETKLKDVEGRIASFLRKKVKSPTPSKKSSSSSTSSGSSSSSSSSSSDSSSDTDYK